MDDMDHDRSADKPADTRGPDAIRDSSEPQRWYFAVPRSFNDMSDAERKAFAAEVFQRLKQALARSQ
jgi:hypothetical protein